MKKILFILLLLPLIKQFSQTWTPIGEEVVSIQTDYGQNCVLYNPVTDKDYKLYMTPVFVFQKGDDNKILAKVTLDQKHQKYRVILTLLVSPIEEKMKIARFVKEKLFVRPGYEKYVDIDIENLIPISFKSIEIKNDEDLFLKYSENENYQSEFSIYTEKNTKDDADEFVKDLKNGIQVINFSINYTLNARITTSVSSANVKTIQIKDTKAAKDLYGVGDNGTIDPSKAQNISVTRSQKNKFEGALHEELSKEITLGNENDATLLLNDMTNYLNSHIYNNQEITKDFEKELNNISKYDFDPNDLKADKITKAVTNVKNYLSDKEQNSLDLGISANAKYALFGADISTNIKKNELVEKLRDNGWSIDQDGESYRVKSISVNVINTENLTKTSTSDFVIIRTQQSEKTLSSKISTSKILQKNNDDISLFGSMPVGAILSYAGDESSIPNGWMLCKGQPLSSKEYKLLFKIIKNYWGKGTGTTSDFNLPDLQGLFLRGVDYTGGTIDKDLYSRNRDKNNSIGNLNEVGSYQDDALKVHRHYSNFGKESNSDAEHIKGESSDQQNRGATRTQGTESVPGNTNDISKYETRPKNVYVNFIIKVR